MPNRPIIPRNNRYREGLQATGFLRGTYPGLVVPALVPRSPTADGDLILVGLVTGETNHGTATT